MSKKTSKKSVKKSKELKTEEKSKKKASAKSKISKKNKSTKDNAVDLNKTFPQQNENLGKLLSDEERTKMKENLEKAQQYLTEIGIVDLKVDEEKFIITVPFEYEEFTFLSHIVVSPEWILIKTSIFEVEHLSKEGVIDLFTEILKGNFLLNSVVYSIDPELKSVWAQADIHESADINLFRVNYFSIIFAIDFFIKNISTKLDLQLKSTMDKNTLQDNSSQLYI